jgi:hypothetical protein
VYFPIPEGNKDSMGATPPPVVKSPPRTHETAAGQPDDFPDDLNALDQVGADEP